MGDLIGNSGLKFFGNAIASISHEIKNRMAIINEQAGLLNDLLYMQKQGRELDPERLKRLADSVKKQVATADGIIKNMNRLAHSVDNVEILRQPVAVDDLMGLAAALAGRKADMQRVTLEVCPPPTPVTANTSPFFLMNLVWLSIHTAIRFIGEKRRIVLSCDRTDEGVFLHLEFDVTATDGGQVSLPEEADVLAEALEADIAFYPDINQIIIKLPVNVGRPPAHQASDK